ncbi:hypothetical protein [Pseudomonas sp. CCC3.1]|uniref:hypothetical protein n=1 Tax=Pseudomonas sp. CCC3.1 TaxID=3048607 RepID=UPI002AC9557A|nr:hypothetical protein [Pseudomonas sp. CCC3.1]MEB0206467.1 hypothetical protein [Pseudomonas sp. CCC3.1]WPX37029.1 hypothetical protein RHM56_02205 [Pseudomonas sp. CCC3.1]
MKSWALGFAAFTISLFSNEVNAQSMTSGGVIHFRGAITEPSYEIMPANAVNFGQATKLIAVAPGVVIAVNMALPGSRGSEPLIDTSFEALKTSADPSGGKRGVLTISYR